MILNEMGSLRVRVFNALEDAIINGEYREGDSLNEIKLAQELGVSRTPIREALMQLELEGLVKNIPNKGAVVIGVSEKDIDDIYAIRMHVEGFAARLCAENIDSEKAAAMQKIVELQEFYLSKSDFEQLWHLDSSFHKMIYDGSQNRPLMYMLSNFHNYIKRARDLSVKATGRADKSVSEHRAILEAIKSRNGDLAESLTKEHIANAKANLLEMQKAK